MKQNRMLIVLATVLLLGFVLPVQAEDTGLMDNMVVQKKIIPLNSQPNSVSKLQVTLSRQKFYMDGDPVQLEAYNINGSNYVKLDDLSKLVGFELSFDSKTNSVYIGEQPQQNDVVVIHQSDARLNLKEGDKVLCDDGYIYEITDMKRYDKSMFASGPLPELPTPTCDWSNFPTTELPKAEVRHFSHEDGDSMFIRNLYETRRMEYTIYNALGDRRTVQIHLSIPDSQADQANEFWPWKESQLVNYVQSSTRRAYYIEAWDYYTRGVYQHTRYCVISE